MISMEIVMHLTQIRLLKHRFKNKFAACDTNIKCILSAAGTGADAVATKKLRLVAICKFL